MKYGLLQRPNATTLTLSALQWFVFMATNVITIPIVLAHAYGMDASQAAILTNHTFLVAGIIGLAQVILGHRMPIIEGPAGMWWGVFLVLIQMTRDAGGSLSTLRQSLEAGLMVAGALTVLLAGFGVLNRIRSWFTPTVTGTFLILLSLQLSRPLLSGLLGIGFRSGAFIDVKVLFLSLGLITLTMTLMTRGKGLLKNMAVLVSISVGWIVYALLGLTAPVVPAGGILAWPNVLPWGVPRFNSGVVITAMITSVVLLSNLIASIHAMGETIGATPTDTMFRKGALVSGVGNILAGTFGTVGMVPLTSAASFVSLTRIASRVPFVVASGMLVSVGFLPALGRLIVTLPAPVGYAVLFAVFGQLLGFGLKDYRRLQLDQRDLFVIGTSLISGVGLFFIPTSAWTSLPPLVGYLLDNGLIVGVVLVLTLEHIVFRETRQESRTTGMF